MKFICIIDLSYFILSAVDFEVEVEKLGASSSLALVFGGRANVFVA